MDLDDEGNSMDSSEVEYSDMESDLDYEDDSGIEFLDTEEVGFELHEKAISPIRNAHEVSFNVYDMRTIQLHQTKEIEEVARILDQPLEATAILLQFSHWNKERLIESYMDRQEEILKISGLDEHKHPTPRVISLKTYTCEICCDDSPNQETFAMSCAHRFCVYCYGTYIRQKIKEEGEAARIRCPGDGCNRIVDSKSLNALVTTDLRDRYQELLSRAYVDDKDNLKWCPAPDCGFAIDCSVKLRELSCIVPTVHCKCGHSFCFGCLQSDHQPTPCSLVKKWLQKCADDSETVNWITANTKECPKCGSTIEKNGGCNHMTCRKCRHEFCWMCLGVWSEHGNSWFKCNRFEEKSGAEARDAQARSRQSLERYLHYYHRYYNHEQSARLDKDNYIRTEQKMTQLQASSGMSWIEVQFLESASRALQQCRQTLKWTYSFAYYLFRNNITEIFEDNQKDLELAVENLSEMFEKSAESLKSLKVEMMDKTAYCTKRRVILLNDTAENLKTKTWRFNVTF